MALQVDALKIEFSDWSREYSFSLAETERLAIQGPSGIGKTTLLLAIAGFIRTTEGHLSWKGLDLINLAPERRPISMLFQDDNLFEHISVRENMTLGLTPELRKHRLDDAIDALGLGQHLNKRPGQLSGGQRQRVGLLRTVLRPEPLVILDEPFAELDAHTRSQAQVFTRESLERDGKTLLMITHQGEDVAALATQTLQLTL